jgi:hypothetical protein
MLFAKQFFKDEKINDNFCDKYFAVFIEASIFGLVF